MSAPTSCPTDIELLKRLLLDMAQERSFDNVLKLSVDRLAEQPEVAFAQIRLVGAGDIQIAQINLVNLVVANDPTAFAFPFVCS